MNGTLSFEFLNNFGLAIEEGTMFGIKGYLIEVLFVDSSTRTVTYAAYQ